MPPEILAVIISWTDQAWRGLGCDSTSITSYSITILKYECNHASETNLYKLKPILECWDRDELNIWDPIHASDTENRAETILLRSTHRYTYSSSFTPDSRYLKTSSGWIDLSPDSSDALSESDHAHTIPFLLDGDWLYRG